MKTLEAIVLASIAIAMMATVSAVAIGIIMCLATIFGELIALVAWFTICAIAIAYLTYKCVKEGSKEDKKYGNKEGRDKYEYVFDDWDAPVLRMYQDGIIIFVPVYSVTYELHRIYFHYCDNDSGDILTSDIDTLADIDELSQVIVSECNL